MEKSGFLVEYTLKSVEKVDKTIDSSVEVWKTAWIVLKTFVWKTFHGVENGRKIFRENKQIDYPDKLVLQVLQGWIGKREWL